MDHKMPKSNHHESFSPVKMEVVDNRKARRTKESVKKKALKKMRKMGKV